MNSDLSTLPERDYAENNAFFPSEYSLKKYTSPKADLRNYDYSCVYKGNKRVLVIASDERYLPVENGKLFSTGNHPVETLVPMFHLKAAGFDFDIATVSGLMVKFEHWAMPKEDERIIQLYNQYHFQFLNPLKLSDVLNMPNLLNDYAAIFIPGGHGALIGLPESHDVAEIIRWAMYTNLFVISICHGPAAFLSLRYGENPLAGYSICAFPDSADKETPNIGYMPGQLSWFFGNKLQDELDITIVNSTIKGSVYKDRKVLTGDSPFAANNLGQLAAMELLKAYTI